MKANTVYICRRSNCNHIVAAFTPMMDNKQLAELMKQFTLAGYRLELATDIDVRMEFNVDCDCNKPKAPPLLDFWEKKTDPETGEVTEDEPDETMEPTGPGHDQPQDWEQGDQKEDPISQAQDQGIETEDINAMAEGSQAEGADY